MFSRINLSCGSLVSNAVSDKLRNTFNFLYIKNYSCNRLWRPTRLWDIEAHTFDGQSAHRWWWGQPYALFVLYPQEDSWYSFLLEAESTQGNSAA
jgi:hypothetical protein